MYLEYYGLKREPFHITPDPSFLYMSPSHKEALGAIIYGVEKRKGFIAIIGEVGVGKTSILRAYLERKASQKQKTIYIFNPVLSFHELLISMFRSLDLTPRHDNVPEMVNQLHEALIAEYQAGGTVVVAIDEAQNMPVETLENLRMFSNLETSTDKLIQIILLGQPELDNLLHQASLRQLKQRIVLWANISPLTREESQSFIEHRIARACTTGPTSLFSESENIIPELFTKSALNLIARKAQGIPRRINILCDNALITGFGRQCKPVPVSVVREIIGDIDTNRAPKPSFRMKWAVGFCLAIIFIVGFILFLDSPWQKNTVEIPSTGKYVDGQASSKNRESKPQSLAVNDQLRQGQKTDLSLDSGSRSPIDIRSVDLAESSSDEQLNSHPKQVILKTENNAVGTKGIESVEPSREFLHRKSVSSSEGGQVATTGKFREGRLREDLGTTISRAKGNYSRTVREGENLSQIAMETYGSQSEKYIEWVKKNNPQIVDPNIILPGQKIVLPPVSKK